MSSSADNSTKADIYKIINIPIQCSSNAANAELHNTPNSLARIIPERKSQMTGEVIISPNCLHFSTQLEPYSTEEEIYKTFNSPIQFNSVAANAIQSNSTKAEIYKISNILNGKITSDLI